MNNTESAYNRSLKKSFFTDWYKKHGREFPWRGEGVTPFQFLVTEMLLRQTDAPSVAKIWHEFFEMYPDVFALASADQDQLRDRVRVLGFGTQRSNALKLAARWIVEHHKGQVPDTLDELLSIPHVGDYAARAVLCFAFGKREEIVDTNIQRFYARYYGLSVKPDTRQNKWLWQMAKDALPRARERAKLHNYGILDFTAQICKAGKPLCEVCPLSSTCEFGKLQTRKEQNNFAKS